MAGTYQQSTTVLPTYRIYNSSKGSRLASHHFNIMLTTFRKNNTHFVSYKREPSHQGTVTLLGVDRSSNRAQYTTKYAHRGGHKKSGDEKAGQMLGSQEAIQGSSLPREPTFLRKTVRSLKVTVDGPMMGSSPAVSHTSSWAAAGSADGRTALAASSVIERLQAERKRRYEQLVFHNTILFTMFLF